VGDRDPKHWRVPLQIETVLQPQGPKLVFAQSALPMALQLLAELPCAIAQHKEIVFRGSVHGTGRVDTGKVAKLKRKTSRDLCEMRKS